MRVEAIYDDGRLELPAGVHLKHSRITLTVVIPDHEIAVGVTGETAQPSAEQGSREKQRGETFSQRPSIREAIDEILGPWKQQIESGPAVLGGDQGGRPSDELANPYSDYR